MLSPPERLYRLLTDATTEDIEEPETRKGKNAPTNFYRLLLSRAGSKISDRLSSPKTTLAWLLQSLGAPPVFTGLIVPIRESGSLLPQLVLSNFLKRFAVRKWAWSLGALIQGLAIAGCGLVALTLEGTLAGASIVALVAVFALARGISSISAKDVLGKTIPKSKRGQLTGWAGSASGIIAIAAAVFLILYDGGDSSVTTYATYLFAAALIWWIAAAVNACVLEPKSEEELPDSPMEGFGEQLKHLKTDAAFRDFLIVRALAIGSGLSTPYIVSLAHKQLGGATQWLGIFIIAEGLAAMMTSPIWGRWADRSSRGVLQIAMLAVFGLLLTAIIYTLFLGSQDKAGYFFPAILFLLAAAHVGVRVGRKTYVVDIAEGNKRTDYVAVGNTLIGVLLILAGVLTGLASLVSVQLSLAIFALCALSGAVYAIRLPRVQK